MSDTRPIPPMKSTKPPRWRERVRELGVRARDYWSKSSFFVMEHKNLRMTSLQLLGALAVLIGISYFSIPCALIVGGLAAIWVAERQ